MQYVENFQQYTVSYIIFLYDMIRYDVLYCIAVQRNLAYVSMIHSCIVLCDILCWHCTVAYGSMLQYMMWQSDA